MALLAQFQVTSYITKTAFNISGFKTITAFRPKLLVSKPDPISNLSFIKLQSGDSVDKQWIGHRQELIHQHHLFWLENNTNFIKAKAEFDNGSKKTPQELSDFYKIFSEQNRLKMLNYNKRLWVEAISLIGPGLKYETRIVRKWASHISRRIQERMLRAFVIFWFSAGLVYPLLIEQ